MKNVEKNIQEQAMLPIMKAFSSDAKCEKDSNGNYYWLMQIANETGVMAGITLRLEHEANTHSGIIVNILAEDYADTEIYKNSFKYTFDSVISEIKKVIELCDLNDNYYIL